jgi:hypothetical protein
MKNKEMWEIVINTFVELELEQELREKEKNMQQGIKTYLHIIHFRSYNKKV